MYVQKIGKMYSVLITCLIFQCIYQAEGNPLTTQENVSNKRNFAENAIRKTFYTYIPYRKILQKHVYPDLSEEVKREKMYEPKLSVRYFNYIPEDESKKSMFDNQRRSENYISRRWDWDWITNAWVGVKEFFVPPTETTTTSAISSAVESSEILDEDETVYFLNLFEDESAEQEVLEEFELDKF